MEVTVVLLLLLFSGHTLAFFLAEDSHCDATDVSPECSATLGASVYIRVLTTAEGRRLRCSKDGSVGVFTVKRNTVTVQEGFRNRTEFFVRNGTLRISGVEREDAGDFSLEVFTSDGIPVTTISWKLHVKENIVSILILSCSALVLLLILGAASCCVYKKVKNHKRAPKPTTDNKLWASGL